MLNRSTTVHFSTTPPILVRCCYVPFFFTNFNKMITESEYLKAKEVVEKYEKQQLEMKELLSKETLTIRIGGCLHERGRISLIPYPKDGRLKIRKQGERFFTITDLKNYYGIKKTTKTGEKEWAISPRGKRYEWDVLEAEISMEYVAL